MRGFSESSRNRVIWSFIFLDKNCLKQHSCVGAPCGGVVTLAETVSCVVGDGVCSLDQWTLCSHRVSWEVTWLLWMSPFTGPTRIMTIPLARRCGEDWRGESTGWGNKCQVHRKCLTNGGHFQVPNDVSGSSEMYGFGDSDSKREKGEKRQRPYLERVLWHQQLGINGKGENWN